MRVYRVWGSMYANRTYYGLKVVSRPSIDALAPKYILAGYMDPSGKGLKSTFGIFLRCCKATLRLISGCYEVLRVFKA